uniref:Uncharacterized protein n=1 Tax=Oryza punctata TaxID=4537 RepID=A0A0E0KGJ0_ORYPU
MAMFVAAVAVSSLAAQCAGAAEEAAGGRRPPPRRAAADWHVDVRASSPSTAKTTNSGSVPSNCSYDQHNQGGGNCHPNEAAAIANSTQQIIN